MPPVPSPFTPGSMPQVFAGRSRQLQQIRGTLGGVATYGTFGGRIRVDTGPRGVGKTSLLKTTYDHAVQAGFLTVWATARADESLVAQLSRPLVEQLDGVGVTSFSGSSFRDRLKALEVELGIGPAKAAVAVELSPLAAATLAAPALRELLHAGSVAAREQGSAGICLLVDEIQAAPKSDLRTLAYAWQEMQVQTGAYGEAPIAAFAVGLANSPDVLTAAVTFSERFMFRTLHRLRGNEPADMLVSTAGTADVDWTEGLLEAVIEAAEGYPHFLQLYGDAVWQVAQPSAGDVLDLPDLEEVREIVNADRDAMFRARWAKATLGEQRILTAMAALGDGPVRRADIAKASGLASSELSVPRRRLMDKGIVEPAGHGNLQFTIPGFAAFVRDEL